MSASKGALELESVRKHFGTVIAVAGVDLQVESGEFFTLLGPSGSGKTTILRLIAGFEQPTSGSIRLDGREVARLSPARRGIGVVFQQYALFPHMTVGDNIGYALKLRRIHRGARRDRIQQVLELVRLEGYERRYPRELSGGQQQRIAVARALVFSPPLLLMDEPLGALDRALRIAMQEELRRIHREIGTTMIYVTHDQEEALAMSDRVGVMTEGKLIQIGTTTDLYERPENEFVARFFGDCNVFPIERLTEPVSGELEVRLNGTRFVARAAARGTASRLLIRPERLRLSGDERDIKLEARLIDALYLGESVRLSAEHPRLGMVTARVDPRHVSAIEPGSTISLYFAPEDSVAIAPSDPAKEGS